MILHKKHKVAFTLVDNQLLNDPRLSWQAKGVMCYLLSKIEGWQVQRADIVAHGADGDTVVRNVLRELRERHYARLEEVREKGRIAQRRLVIDEHGNLPNDEFLEKPHAGFPHEENPPSNKTETNKTKKEKVSFDFADADLQREWEAWQQHRIEMHKPITPTARGRQVMFIASIGKERAIAAIRHSIQKGWTGIFEAPARDQKKMPYRTRQDKINELNRRKVALLRMEQTPKVKMELEQIRIQLFDL